VLSVIVSSDEEFEGSIELQRLLTFAFKRIPSSPVGHWEVTVRLAETAEVVNLHRQFFGDASDTDVISFPSGELEANLDHGGYLGDIAVSVPFSIEQAADQGHSHLREVGFLSLHGLLHLLGFNDSSPEKRDEMLGIQASLLDAYESSRGNKL
jgi:probable rRNA maturation factor